MPVHKAMCVCKTPHVPHLEEHRNICLILCCIFKKTRTCLQTPKRHHHKPQQQTRVPPCDAKSVSFVAGPPHGRVTESNIMLLNITVCTYIYIYMYICIYIHTHNIITDNYIYIYIYILEPWLSCAMCVCFNNILTITIVVVWTMLPLSKSCSHSPSCFFPPFPHWWKRRGRDDTYTHACTHRARKGHYAARSLGEIFLSPQDLHVKKFHTNWSCNDSIQTMAIYIIHTYLYII